MPQAQVEIIPTKYNANDPIGSIPFISSFLGTTPATLAENSAKAYLKENFNTLQDNGMEKPMACIFKDPTGDFKFAVYDGEQHEKWQLINDGALGEDIIPVQIVTPD